MKESTLSMKTALKVLSKFIATGLLLLSIAILSLYVFGAQYIKNTYKIQWDHVYIRWGHIAFDNLRPTVANGENTLSIKKISLYFDIGRLMDKEIKSVIIEGITIPLQWDANNTLTLPALPIDSPSKAKEPFQIPQLGITFLKTEIKDIKIKIRHETHGDFSVKLAPTSFNLKEQGMSSAGAWALQSIKGGFAGKYNYKVKIGVPLEEAVEGNLIITSGNISAMDTTDISGEIQLKNQKLDYNIKMKNLSPSPDFVPVDLEINGQSDLTNKTGFTCQISLPSTDFTLKGKGEHFFSGEGKMSLISTPLRLNKKHLPVHKLWKSAPPLLKKFTGELTTKTNLTWTPDRLNINLNLGLKRGHFSWQGYTLEGIETKLHITNLFPLQTAKNQVLHIHAIKGPVTLKNSSIIYESTPKGGLKIKEVSVKFSEGTLKTSSIPLWPLKFPLSFDIKVNNIALEEVAKLLDIEGLSAAGTLSGTIPMTIHPNFSTTIKTAHIHAIDNGYIRYKPTQKIIPTEDSSTALVSQALENLQFNFLKMDITKIAGLDTKFYLEIKGNNPEVLNGYPFLFRINVTGPLEAIIQKTLDVMLSNGKLNKNILKSAHD